MPANQLRTSIIIPTYNRSKLLVRAIASAQPQMQQGDEILVMDDGSTDDTEAVVKSLTGNIRYFRLPNGGPSNARNIGMQEAQGDLIAFLDDDDEWMPHKLALQRALMQQEPEVVFCFSNFSSQYQDGRTEPNCVLNWGQREKRWENIFSASAPFSTIAALPAECPDFTAYIGNIYQRQMHDDYVLPSTQMVRKCAATAGLTFPADLRFCESWAFSSKLAKVGLAAYLDIDTIYQHDHGGPRLTGVNLLEQTTSRIKVLERQWGQDAEFLASHGGAYQRRLDEERLLRIRELLALSRTADARKDINRLHHSPPRSYRILSHLPSVLMQTLNATRRILKP